MITLITGTPGSGKTLFTVSRLVQEINKTPDRTIFADIDGLKIEGVETPPDDWRDAPEGSLIIYDEVQYRDAYRRGRGASKVQYILDLTTHRHGGYDIWIISQSPAFIHSDVLGVVGMHYHVDRPYGASLAYVSRWRDAQKNPKSRDSRASVEAKTLFKYDKKLFDYYSSVDVSEDKANHKKFSIPFSQYKFILIGGLIVAYALYGLYGSFSNNADDVELEVKNAELQNPFDEQQNNNQFYKSSDDVPVEQQLSEQQLSEQQLSEQQLSEQQLFEQQLFEQQLSEQQLSEQQLSGQHSVNKVFNPLTSEYVDFNLAPVNVVSFSDVCKLYNHSGQLLLNYDYSECLLYLNNPSLLVKPFI